MQYVSDLSSYHYHSSKMHLQNKTTVSSYIFFGTDEFGKLQGVMEQEAAAVTVSHVRWGAAGDGLQTSNFSVR